MAAVKIEVKRLKEGPTSKAQSAFVWGAEA
jgi:hypothetical protein